MKRFGPAAVLLLIQLLPAIVLENESFRGFAWGQEIVKQVEEEKGEAKTTAYTFYQDPAEKDRYSRVESVTNPDGSWEKYDYDYDQKGFFGRLMQRVVASGAAGTSKSQ